jgi:myosin heavy subunit
MSGSFINAVLLLLTLVYTSTKFNFITSFKPKEHSSEYKEHSSEYKEHSLEYKKHSSEYKEHSSECKKQSSEYKEHSSEYKEHSSDYEEHSSEYKEHSSEYKEHSSEYKEHSSEYKKHSSEFKEHSSEYKSVLVYFPSLFTVDLPLPSIEMKWTAYFTGRRKNARLNLQKITVYQNISIKYLTNVCLLKIKENALQLSTLSFSAGCCISIRWSPDTGKFQL